MSKRILVVCGNPKANSFCESLANSYVQQASQKNEVALVSLSQLQFNPDLNQGYDQVHTMEQDLIDFQASLTWAEHVVIFTPIWWGSIPAKFKGLIDRSLLPGFAFQYQEGKTMPDQLLVGKTARVIITLDTPPWYYKWVQGAPAVKELKIATLKFCGFQPVKTKLIGPIISSNDTQRAAWTKEVERLGGLGA